MANIVLSWWGDYTDSIKIDTLYKSMLAWKRILYIPRAMYPDKYSSCSEWIQSIFAPHDWYTVHVLSEQEDFTDSEHYLNTYDGIYIWWGNTYRLLKLLKDTWCWDVIKTFIDHNKPIYGWSAWAIIMGKEINTSSDRNVVRLSLMETLWYDVGNGYAIACHHHERKNNELIDYVLHYQIPVICLPEWTGVICKNNTCTIAGEKPAYIIDTKWHIQEIALWSSL